MSIMAWRYWRWGLMEDSDRTMSLTLHGLHGGRWEIDQPMRADCHRNVLDRCHITNYVAPSVDCTCGIYALKQVADTETPNNLRRRGFSVWTKQYKFIHDDPAAIYLPLTDTWYKVQGTLLGVTELWGKIIVAEKGYRAEYGRLRALVCAPFDEIATGYEVPNLPSTDYAREEYFA